jgi:class 3 adenylate cyclase
MFCDLVGSTALSSRLDPEAWVAFAVDDPLQAAIAGRRW